MRTLAFPIAALALPCALLAQWPDHRDAAAPRLPDGKVNLDAPAPRASDGHPDLSGVWQFRGNRGRNSKEPPTPDTGGPPEATFRNVAAGFKDGLPLRPAAATLLKQRMAQNSKDNPDAHCLPLGLMQLHLHPQPRKIIQTPAELVILYEAQSGIRQVFTDGRPLPENNPDSWWYGYSVGKWDGDTLVVETTGFRDDVWLDINGSPLTHTGKMTERFRRINYGHMEIQVTIEDPSVYTRPWTVKVDHYLMPDTQLIEFICNENERSDAHLVGK
ncbi:MAG TPA: hypothetical protein VJ732_19705 [Bryobacteraceae bacterium]|nr:hypothetical protein [Bryobacteraceae bacterium]